jgi:hypothetical protein
MKTVICNSGLKGWQCNLQENYSSFDEFKSYSKMYNLAKKLGYTSMKKAWNENPIIQGSTNPLDFRKVKPT